MKRSLFTIFILFLNISLSPEIKLKYRFSYHIEGNAKGRILLIFPYRVYYSSKASAIFSASPVRNGLIFKLSSINETGFMMRTLGFSGRSFAILTAGNDLKKSKIFADNISNQLDLIIPEYSRFIKKKYWNNYYFNRIKERIKFFRSDSGVNNNVFYDLWLKKSPHKNKISISFNIYRILGEIIKIYNHPFLPENVGIDQITRGEQLSWTSEGIDYSRILNKSARFAAGIFKLISPLKQERPFKVNYTAKENNSTISIVGKSYPDVSIWNSFLIKKFSRSVKISVKDGIILSDIIEVIVKNGSGKGGTFKSTLELQN